ncbi:hypothetical protein GCM10010246_75280 [Streptomyces cuspidosporus]|uniref:Uncharacterized protein n=1 Tax=Streptomyces cuspidosporus TaxID=66882 RepID=A0ABN3H622_9ACTN
MIRSASSPVAYWPRSRTCSTSSLHRIACIPFLLSLVMLLSLVILPVLLTTAGPRAVRPARGHHAWVSR